MKPCVLSAGLVVGAILAGPAMAGAPQPEQAIVAYVPADSGPTLPRGLKVACMASPNSLRPDKTCPVIHYQGMTTWAYSYEDNRLAMALVTYDATGRIVRKAEKEGARYVWNMVSSYRTHQITIAGQDSHTIELTWNDVGR